MCVIIAVNQLGFGAMIPSLPLYAQTFGVSLGAIGFAVAIYGLARFAGALPAGRLADRLGRRPTLAIGGLVSGLGNAACALAPDYGLFLGARFVAGLGASLVLVTGIIILADISRREHRGRMMSIYQGVFTFSVGIGPLPGGWLAGHIGLDAPFWAHAGMSLAAAGVAWFAIPESREMQEQVRSAAESAKGSLWAALGALRRRTAFLLICSVSFAQAFTRTGGLFSVIPVLGAGFLGLSALEIGSGMAVGSVLGLLVVYPAGSLVDRFGRKTVIVPATLTAASAFVVFSFASGYPGYLLASAVWGIATSIAGSSPAAYAADTAPPGMNAAGMSSFRMLSDLGYVVGPIAMGYMADLVGPRQTVVWAGGLLLVVGVAFAILAPETHKRARAG